MRLIVSILLTFLFYTAFSQKEDSTKTYYPNGKIQSVGVLKNGKPIGLWKTFYPNGNLKSIGEWKNGLLNGEWVFLDLYGDTSSTISYLNGKRNGFSLDFYKNSDKVKCKSVKAKELYVNNKRQGESFYYYPCGKLKSKVSYTDNVKDGIETLFDNEGGIIGLNTYKYGDMIRTESFNQLNNNGLKEGEWRTFYSNGVLKRSSTYNNGILDGVVREYNNKGELVSSLIFEKGSLIDTLDNFKYEIDIKEEYDTQSNLIYRGGFLNAIPVGTHNWYDTTGKVTKTLIYSNKGNVIAKGIINRKGKREGAWFNYYQNGTLSSEGTYSNNKPDGEWNYYYPSKKIEQKGAYRNGRKQGKWIWYYENGSIWKEENYYNGNLEGWYVEYNKLDEIITEGEYIDNEKEGEWKVKNGDHLEQGKYIYGLKDGLWRTYFNTGSIHFEGNYIQGSEEGKHKYYYPNGTLKEEQFYKSGVRVKHWKKYNELGELTITITYKNNKEFRINGVKVEFYNSSVINIH